MPEHGLKLLSYNAQEALADPRRAEGVVRLVEAETPALAVIHSAYWTRSNTESPMRDEDSPTLTATVRRLGDLGYEVTQQDEGDTTARPDKTGFVGIVRAGLGTGDVMNVGTRQGYIAAVQDRETGRNILVGGLHITDTDEISRLDQVASLPRLDVLLTDANAMHRGARVARALRALRPLTDRVPDYGGRDFNGAMGIDKLRAYGHLLQSLAWMADGRTMDALEELGLIDADPKRQPTIHLGRFGVAQLDHAHYDPTSVTVENFRVHREVGGADHWPVSVTAYSVAI